MIKKPLITFGYNSSGQDSGELDYSLAISRIDRLHLFDIRELVMLMDTVLNKLEAIIIERKREGGS